MALGKIARDKSPPQTKNRGQRLTLTINPVFSLGEVFILILGFTFPLLMMIQMDQFAPPVSAVPLLLLFGLILRDATRIWCIGGVKHPRESRPQLSEPPRRPAFTSSTKGA